MKLWCTLLQFWIPNPGEYSVFFPENTYFFLIILWVLFCGIFYVLFVGTYISLVQFSRPVMSDSLRPHKSQHARPPWPSPIPGVYSTSCASSGYAIQPSCPLSSPFPPAPNPSQCQGRLQWVFSNFPGSFPITLHKVAKILEFQLQHQSFQQTPRTDLLLDGLFVSPCSPRDSQKSSPTPQFKNIKFSAFSFLHSPALPSIHDHWKNHSLD